MILKRMSRRSWGYFDIAPERSGAPRSEWLVRLTPAGRQAQQIWAPLADMVTNRWQLRFGAGTPVPRLSELSGIAGMGIENSLSALGRRGHVVVERDPAAGRARLARLTASGLQARAAYLEGVAGVEREWERRCGKHTVHAVREAVQLPLLSGLTPYPDGWRAQLPPFETLPHFPFVSHRGGYPDGS
jgi:DNA-binding MarR family transcriptional regulator